MGTSVLRAERPGGRVVEAALSTAIHKITPQLPHSLSPLAGGEGRHLPARLLPTSRGPGWGDEQFAGERSGGRVVEGRRRPRPRWPSSSQQGPTRTPTRRELVPQPSTSRVVPSETLPPGRSGRPLASARPADPSPRPRPLSAGFPARPSRTRFRSRGLAAILAGCTPRPAKNRGSSSGRITTSRARTSPRTPSRFSTGSTTPARRPIWWEARSAICCSTGPRRTSTSEPTPSPERSAACSATAGSSAAASAWPTSSSRTASSRSRPSAASPRPRTRPATPTSC